MSDYFAPYKDHRAVVLYDRMFPKFFNFSTPPTLILYLTDPPALELLPEFESGVRRIAEQRKRL